jgi:hypothetical protein
MLLMVEGNEAGAGHMQLHLQRIRQEMCDSHQPQSNFEADQLIISRRQEHSLPTPRTKFSAFGTALGYIWVDVKINGVGAAAGLPRAARQFP